MLRLKILLASILLSLSADARAKPNIIFIMADDLGYGDISCYGSDRIKTPNIDMLANNGIRFTDYHSNGAVCSPTRAALMTGRYQQRTGVEGVITAKSHREVGLSLGEITIAEMLKDAGYSTAIFGKWHLGYDVEDFGPLRQGFDTFEGFVSGNVDYFNKIDQEAHKDWWIGDRLEHVDGYVTDIINDRGVEWLAKQHEENKGKPFFLYLAHGAPHYPLQGPDDQGFRKVGEKVGQPKVDAKATYKAMIESMDAGIGRVVTELEKLGLSENTMVIFCSDNGQARSLGSAGPFRGNKGTVYEGGHRVPMVMQWKSEVPAGVASEIPFMGMDFFPTFASLVGAELPEDLVIDGVDMSGQLKANPEWQTRILHWVHNNQVATREGSWKLVSIGDKNLQLYDLSKDPAESDDLAPKHPDLVADLKAKQDAWLVEVRKGVEPVSGGTKLGRF